MIIPYVRTWFRYRKLTRPHVLAGAQPSLWDHHGREVPPESPEYRQLLYDWLWVSLLDYYQKKSFLYKWKQRNASCNPYSDDF